MLTFSQGILRSECTTEVLMAGFIWDNMPLVEKAIDAIDFTRIREGVKINKFPGFLDLNRWDFFILIVDIRFAGRTPCGRTSDTCRKSLARLLIFIRTLFRWVKFTKSWEEIWKSMCRVSKRFRFFQSVLVCHGISDLLWFCWVVCQECSYQSLGSRRTKPLEMLTLNNLSAAGWTRPTSETDGGRKMHEGLIHLFFLCSVII